MPGKRTRHNTSSWRGSMRARLRPVHDFGCLSDTQAEVDDHWVRCRRLGGYSFVAFGAEPFQLGACYGRRRSPSFSSTVARIFINSDTLQRSDADAPQRARCNARSAPLPLISDQNKGHPVEWVAAMMLHNRRYGLLKAPEQLTYPSA